MPSVSKSQARLFGMVRAYQKGETKNPPEKIKEVAEHISPTDAKHFAETKHQGLPEHVKKANIMNEHFVNGFIKRASEYGLSKGQAVDVLCKVSGVGIGMGGAIFGPLSGLAADKGKGWSTAGGALLGGAAGGAAGAIPGALSGNPALAQTLAALGMMTGGYTGARWGHGDLDKKDDERALLSKLVHNS